MKDSKIKWNILNKFYPGSIINGSNLLSEKYNRSSYTTHLLEQGTDIRSIQELLGHKYIRVALIYTDFTNNNTQNIRSPLNKLLRAYFVLSNSC